MHPWAVPEFDPGSIKHHKIFNMASIFGWNDKLCLHHTVSKLKGADKFWFEGYQAEISGWLDFKSIQKEGFPMLID